MLLKISIWNLRPKESVGVKFKQDICAKLRLKLWFVSDWYFYNITKSWWFWKRRMSKRKVRNNHFRSSRTKMFFKIDVLRFRNIHTKMSVLSLFLIKFIRHKGQLSLKNNSSGCFCQFDKVKVQESCRSSVLN